MAMDKDDQCHRRSKSKVHVVSCCCSNDGVPAIFVSAGTSGGDGGKPRRIQQLEDLSARSFADLSFPAKIISILVLSSGNRPTMTMTMTMDGDGRLMLMLLMMRLYL
jgi:hypothetical protein